MPHRDNTCVPEPQTGAMTTDSLTRAPTGLLIDVFLVRVTPPNQRSWWGGDLDGKIGFSTYEEAREYGAEALRIEGGYFEIIKRTHIKEGH